MHRLVTDNDSPPPETKNQWARDDPAFICVFLWLVVMATCAWSLAIHASFTQLVFLVLWVGLFDFFIASIVISTALWAFANKFLLMRASGAGSGPSAFSSPRPPSSSSSSSFRRSPGAIDYELGAQHGHDHLMVSHQSVEWLYALDIHLNSFFPLWVLLYVIQYFLLMPLLAYPTSFLSTLVANTLYLVAAVDYYYISFLGYTGTESSCFLPSQPIH